jgi:hypothetical protein
VLNSPPISFFWILYIFLYFYVFELQNIYTYIRSALSSETVTDYFIVNRKLSQIFLDVRVYRGSDVGSNSILTLHDTDFHQNGYIYPKKTARKGNIPHYKIILIKDGCKRWPYKQIKNTEWCSKINCKT